MAFGRDCATHQTIHDLFSSFVVFTLLSVASPLSLPRTLLLAESFLGLREGVRDLVLQLLIAEELEPSVFEPPEQVPDVSALFRQDICQLLWTGDPFQFPLTRPEVMLH